MYLLKHAVIGGVGVARSGWSATRGVDAELTPGHMTVADISSACGQDINRNRQ